MGAKDRPIYSTRADDPEVGENIDAFVIDLAERVDALQDAEGRGDLKLLAALAGALIESSEDNGFDSLSACASVVEVAADEENAEAARAALLDLTEVARRIRLGHRGAV